MAKKLTHQQVAEQLAERMQRFVSELGYERTNVVVLDPSKRGRWGVYVGIGSIGFTPYANGITVSSEYGHLTLDWKTPDGFELENYTDNVVLVYDA